MALTQISTQGIKDGTITGSDLATNVDLVDNQKIRFGTGNDLEIFHSGSNSFIKDTGFGNLVISGSQVSLESSNLAEFMVKAIENAQVELYHNGSKKFETTSTGATITGRLNMTEGIDIPDGGDNNTSLSIGSGNDLRLYHDGSNSFIKDRGTGNLYIRGDDTLFIQSDSGEDKLKATTNGSVEIYFDNSKKFETTSAGATLTGSLTVTNDIHLEDNLLMGDTDKIRIGNSQDLEIFHDGSNSFITDGGGSTGLVIQAPLLAVKNAAGSENMIVAVENGSVELNYDNTKRFETTSVGVNTTGNLNVTDGQITITHSVPALNLTDNSDPNGNDFAIQVNTNLFKIVDTTNSNRLGFQFGSDGNTQLGGNVTISGSIFLGTHLDMGDSDIIKLGDGDDFQIYHDGNSHALSSSGNMNIGCTNNESIYIKTNNTNRWRFWYDGHFRPIANNTYDIGSPSLRIANIYTNDLNLSNEGSSNDVDGTWGSYTIQEGAEDLFLVNKRNGKKYKFNLTEVS